MDGDITKAMGERFNPSTVKAVTGFDPIPPGWYSVYIDHAEVKETKAGDGMKLEVEMTVVGGPFSGRKVFPMINFMNPSQRATEIGREQLARLSKACDLKEEFFEDSSEVVGKTIVVMVTIDISEGYNPRNKVTAYKPIGEATTVIEEKGAHVLPQVAPTQRPVWEALIEKDD